MQRTATTLGIGLAIVVFAFGPGNMAVSQEAADSTDATEPVVLNSELERWVNTQYWSAALCRETLYQMINEHKAFTSPKGLENARNLTTLLTDLIDAARTELYAKGMTFEQSYQIDSYFYAATQPKTARFAETKDPSALAIDIRTCPAAAARLKQWLAEISS